VNPPLPSGPDVAGLERLVGHRFSDPSLGFTALSPSRPGFSRLEFVGDAVLGLSVISAAIAHSIPHRTAIRTMSNDHLDAIFDRTFAHLTPVRTGDIVEATIGALFLDAGFEVAARAAVTVALGEVSLSVHSAAPTPPEHRDACWIGAQTLSTVVAAHLVETRPEARASWFSETRSSVLARPRLARIARESRLTEHDPGAGPRALAAASDDLEARVGNEFLRAGWTGAVQTCSTLRVLPRS